MNRRALTRATLIGLLLVAMSGLAGCSPWSVDSPPDAYENHLEQARPDAEDYIPSDSEIEQAQQDIAAQYEQWSCTYEPTMNEDWHDDVICRHGYDIDRPYLREWDDFVTQDELMSSAAEYEAELNAGLIP